MCASGYITIFLITYKYISLLQKFCDWPNRQTTHYSCEWVNPIVDVCVILSGASMARPCRPSQSDNSDDTFLLWILSLISVIRVQVYHYGLRTSEIIWYITSETNIPYYTDLILLWNIIYNSMYVFVMFVSYDMRLQLYIIFLIICFCVMEPGLRVSETT